MGSSSYEALAPNPPPSREKIWRAAALGLKAPETDKVAPENSREARREKSKQTPRRQSVLPCSPKRLLPARQMEGPTESLFYISKHFWKPREICQKTSRDFTARPSPAKHPDASTIHRQMLLQSTSECSLQEMLAKHGRGCSDRFGVDPSAPSPSLATIFSSAADLLGRLNALTHTHMHGPTPRHSAGGHVRQHFPRLPSFQFLTSP